MDKFSREEIENALRVVSSTISKCEKMQLKFAEGTSQHTLLKNRLKAMYISNSLIKGENVTEKYSKDELIEALNPVSSIISKCEKGRLKFTEGTSHYTRFDNIIKAMYVAKSLITDEINKIYEMKV
jgi:molybdopterin-binding protein